jgi:DNA polymerase I
MKICILLDTKFLLYRSVTTQFHLTHNDSITGAHFSYWNTVKSIAKKFKPTNTIAMFDSDKSYRRDIFPSYKVKRKTLQKDQNLIQQLITIKDEAETLRKNLIDIGFATYLKESLEADDLFALYIRQFFNKYDKFIIITADADMYQLLQENKVEIYDPSKKKLKTERWFWDTYKIHPIQWIYVKTYAGCKSDGVPGIFGVSEEAAIKHIRGEKESKKIRENYDSELIHLYRKLVTLPFPIKTSKLLFKQTKLDMDKLFDYFQSMGFKSFLEKMNEFEELFG